MNETLARVAEAARFIQLRAQFNPRIAIVLGSGFAAVAGELDSAISISYEHIPNFPTCTATGHAGRLFIATLAGIPVVVMQGRPHLYEGYSAEQVAFPVRVLGQMGVRAMVLTNGAGGIHREYSRGSLVVIRDHINLQGHNPLRGVNDEIFGGRFLDMTDAYSERFRRFTMEENARLGGELHEGVYAAVLGPSYETPAEIRFLRTIGADLVGMSTVPEVIAARQMDIEVLAISCVTNPAAGITGEKISHKEVLDTGEQVRGRGVPLLRALLPRIAQTLPAR